MVNGAEQAPLRFRKTTSATEIVKAMTVEFEPDTATGAAGYGGFRRFNVALEP